MVNGQNDIGKIITGVVSKFDEHVGLGEVTASSGEIYPFHCINIADGTRKIDMGVQVQAEIYYHPRQRIEVKDLKPL